MSANIDLEKEIEITPQMIEAGAKELISNPSFQGLDDSARLIVQDIYRAMESART